MPTLVSPGVYVQEFDFSEVAANLGTTRALIAGAATKGSLSTPIAITNEAELIQELGKPLLDDYGLQAAIQYLKKGRQLLYLRVANVSNPTYGAIPADRPLPGETGGTAAVAATGSISFTGSANPLDGETIVINDGANAVAAFGRVTINAQPDDGDYLIVDDGLGTAATATANHTASPADGATLTLNDAYGNTVVFEYDTNSSVGGGNVAVDISATATNGAEELRAAINAHVALQLTATRVLNVVTVTHDHRGNKGNNATIATSTVNVTLSGATLLGGNANARTFEFDSNLTTTAGSVAVTIGATILDTLYNLIQAVNLQTTLRITASDNTVANGGIPQIRLTHDVEGAAGNTAVSTKIDADNDLTILAFAGGADGAPTTFEFDNNNIWTPGRVPVLIGATALATMANLLVAINASTIINAIDNTITVPAAALTHSIPGAQANFVITETGANIAVTGMAGGTEAVPGPIGTTVTIVAISPGTWGNLVRAVISATGVLNAPVGSFDLVIQAPVDETGTLANVERFENVNLDPLSARYLPLVLEEGLLNEVSRSAYISATSVSANGKPSPGTYTLGQSPGNAGRDGIRDNTNTRIITASDIIGAVTGQSVTGLQAIKNPETVEFNVIAVPGITHKDVINELLSICAQRGDAIAIIDPPFGLTRDEAVAWHNGLYTGVIANPPTTQLDSSYATLAWPWAQVDDGYNNRRVYLPPSGFYAGIMAYTDQVAGPWRPAAGHNRGVILANRIEFSPTITDRDVLLGGQNAVNPWVNFASTGITLMGNRTLLRRASALRRVDVRRMLLHAEKLIATAVKYLVFEPNDPQTWRKFELLVNPILSSIQAQRGLKQFRIRCDETTNTTARRAAGRMLGKIQLIPADVAEIIEIDFSVFASGAEFVE